MNESLNGAKPISALRFITCGSVDDGKSTLVGRLLFDCGAVPRDQLDQLRRDSAAAGDSAASVDYSLLFDGLEAEREQGITIDVAHRYFSTPRRRYIVADTPGHEQYTRNMVTAASTADLAVILVDATRGLLSQTRRHSFIVSLLRIRSAVFAITKMDCVAYSAAVFNEIAAQCRTLAADVGLASSEIIPVSGRVGDNVVHAGLNMPWYLGPTLFDVLETCPATFWEKSTEPLRIPVQYVARAADGFRGYCGTIASGSVRQGDTVCIQPSGQLATVSRLVGYEADCHSAQSAQAVMIEFAQHIDVSRGDLICAADSPAPSGSQFDATLVWMSQSPLLSGREYELKIASRTAIATVTRIKYKFDPASLAHIAAETLAINDIASAELHLDRPIAFDPYERNRDTGAFILVDRVSFDTVAAGMINFALRRSSNLRWQKLEIDKAAHAKIKQQQPCLIWLTGLSGAGKSTIANLLEKRLYADGRHTYILDGDNVRHGLNKDLGFTEADRVENVRRVAEVSKLMVDAGLIVITAFISPFRSERRFARELFAAHEFVEIYVDVPLAIAEARDPKGLYRKARSGVLPNFTGIDSAYEPPEHPDLRIDTSVVSAEEAVNQIIAFLGDRIAENRA
ncbi:MAG TPA: adenylyl-sulfate kinase [Casimicrobium sp.]|nr:adenylyl-sulfate kinase [Casimicrobium sp.]